MYAREYELTYIVRPDVDEDGVSAVQEKATSVISDQGGTLLHVDDWGVRKLAYEIEKYSKGNYVLVKFLSEPSAIAELERTLRIDDRVIRFLTVKIEDRVDVEARVAEEQTRQAALASQAATEAAADADIASA